MFPGRSFTARLIIPLTAGCALVIAGGLLLDYQLSRGRIVEDLERNAKRATQDTALRLEEMAVGVESSARLVGESLRSLPDENATWRLLQGIVDSNPHVFGAALAWAPQLSASPAGHAPYLYRDGEALRRVDLTRGDQPYWEQPWFTEAAVRGEPVWVDPYFDRDGGQVLMTTFAAPVYRQSAEGREFAAVVTADLAIGDLHDYLESLRIDSAGFGFLLTRSGTLIGSPDGPIIVEPLETAVTLDEPGADPAAALRTGEALEGRVWPVRCPRSGGDCLLRLRAVDRGSWGVGVVYSEEALLAPLRNYETRVFSVGVIMLILLAMVISLVTRRLVRPLRALASASEAIARGELDVSLPAARTNDEVGQLLRSFDRMRRDLGSYIDEVERAAAAQSRMDGELNAAREIQMAMLPQGGTAREVGAHIELWARVRPARAVGGDLYSYQRYNDRLLFAIGDVSDKGIPAALFMARAISLVQQWEVQPATVPPHIVMQQLNEALNRDNENCMFLTLFLGVLDKRTGELIFASGGHGPPRLIRDGEVEVIAQERGPALGLSSGIDFPMNRWQLQPGDCIALYTDGFDEALNDREELLGEARVDALLRGNDPVDVRGERLFAAVDDFANGAPQFDDMTLLLVSLASLAGAEGARSSILLAIDEKLPRLGISWLEDAWHALALWPEGLPDVQLVLEELLCNIRDHAEVPAGARAQLSIDRIPGGVRLTCRDPGKPHNPLTQGKRSALGKATLDAPIGGLGLHLVTSLTDSQSYRRGQGHNILTVEKRRPGEAEGE